MVDDQIKLLAFQQALEQEMQQPDARFVGLSLNQTVRACLIHGQSKKADKLKSDFKMPDKR